MAASITLQRRTFRGWVPRRCPLWGPVSLSPPPSYILGPTFVGLPATRASLAPKWFGEREISMGFTTNVLTTTHCPASHERTSGTWPWFWDHARCFRFLSRVPWGALGAIESGHLARAPRPHGALQRGLQRGMPCGHRGSVARARAGASGTPPPSPLFTVGILRGYALGLARAPPIQDLARAPPIQRPLQGGGRR